MLRSFNAPKCETNARLCLGRIRLLKNKKNMQLRGYRKDIADLLRSGKLDYAIIRVESVIREQLTLTAYEILELFLELVAVRAAMMAQSKTIPGDMMEAVSSMLYASARCPELEELAKLRALFENKYGKEYVAAALSDAQAHRFSVNERLAGCLTVEPPPPDAKLQALSEVAQEYAVEWDAAAARRVLLGDYGAGAGGGAGAQAPAAAAGGLAGDYAAAAAGQQQQHTGGADSVGLLAPLVAPPAQAPPAAAAPLPMHPLPPQQQQPSEYADIAAAAQAAAVAAQQARAAADAAARMAQAAAAAGGGGAGGGGGGGGGGGLTAAGAGSSSAAAAPAAAAPGQQQWQPRVPSSEEIQRAYNAAQGPPSKPVGLGGVEGQQQQQPSGAAAPPPAAPPVKATDADVAAAAAAAAAGVASGSSSGASDLPSVPRPPGSGVLSGGSSTSAPGPAAGGGGGVAAAGASEYDELQRRFEALKKS